MSEMMRSWGRRGALVDEVKGDPIRDQIPLPHGHGSVKWRLSHDLLPLIGDLGVGDSNEV